MRSPKYWTMSLRSGSPCTSTSRPSSSWSLITRSISARMRASYSVSSISPLRSAARAARTSCVCGKEPMVVVGKGGSPRRSLWASLRRSKVLSRVASSSVSAATRSRTRGLRVRVEVRRLSSALALRSSSSLLGPPARASAATSCSFSVANAIQERSSASRSVSGSSEIGTCCCEPLVRAREEIALAVGPVLDEGGLVELYPLRVEAAQDLRVHVHQRVEQIEHVEPVLDGLRKEQERERADQHRLGLDAERLCLGVLVER